MKAQYRPIIPQESNSFRAEFQERKEFDSPWHYHSEYELTLILSSRGVRYVGNHFEDFKENDLVLIGADLPHCWSTTGPQTSPASAIVIQWKADLLGKDWINCKEFEAFKRLFQLSQKGVKFDESTAIGLREKFINLINLPPLNKLLSLLEILQELTHAHQFTLCEQNFKYNLNGADNDRIKLILQYMDSNFTQKITLASLAAQVAMNEESFSRFFSKVMKKPFFLFLNEYRINMACKMLVETDMQIAEICYAVGYESIPFFYRQFKKFRQCTPKSLRQKFHSVDNHILL